jgi:hypothetical protein
MLAIRLSTDLGVGVSAEDEAERRFLREWEWLEPELIEYGAIQVAIQSSARGKSRSSFPAA